MSNPLQSHIFTGEKKKEISGDKAIDWNDIQLQFLENDWLQCKEEVTDYQERWCLADCLSYGIKIISLAKQRTIQDVVFLDVQL